MEIPSCVRGYHVYKDIWAAAVGELLTCSREPTNANDSYAVAVIKDGTTIGHIPWRICKVCSVFLRMGGLISCKVTGLKRFSHDLPQGGLEIPCTYLFSAKQDEIAKLKKWLKKIVGLKKEL